MKSGNLKLLEPSGPVQACNGIALPIFVIIPITCKISAMQVDTQAADIKELVSSLRMAHN